MSDGAGIIMAGVLVTVDSECPVAISSLGEGECQQPPTTESTVKPSTTDNTAAIIGGVVAVILIITFAVVAIIMTLILKNRCGNVSINKKKSELCSNPCTNLH